jgi:hypothetical protein
MEDITLTRSVDTVSVQIRFKGGRQHEMVVDLPKSAWKARETPKETIEEIDRLTRLMTDKEIVKELNQRDIPASHSSQWNAGKIRQLRRYRGLKSRFDHLREQGFLTVEEMARELEISTTTVRIWYHHGLLKAHDYNDKGERLYERPPADQRPTKQQGQHGKLTGRKEALLSQASNRVQ